MEVGRRRRPRITAAPLGTARRTEAIRGTSTMEVSSRTRRSQSRGISSDRRNPPVFGSNSRRRWIVLASMPVASVIRLAARPVGAASRTLTDFTVRIFRIDFTRVVFPTPGPPVITMTLDANAIRTASFWLAANATPSLPSTQVMALSASISGQGGLPARRRVNRLAITRSASQSFRRKTQSRSPVVPATTIPSLSSNRIASSRIATGISRCFSAMARRSSWGSPQWPSSTASRRV
ncbi:hypothetical protein [Azospirillum doebereinerae]